MRGGLLSVSRSVVGDAETMQSHVLLALEMVQNLRDHQRRQELRGKPRGSGSSGEVVPTVDPRLLEAVEKDEEVWSRSVDAAATNGAEEEEDNNAAEARKERWSRHHKHLIDYLGGCNAHLLPDGVQPHRARCGLYLDLNSMYGSAGKSKKKPSPTAAAAEAAAAAAAAAALAAAAASAVMDGRGGWDNWAGTGVSVSSRRLAPPKRPGG